MNDVRLLALCGWWCVAACQPQARRLLLLDEALTPGAELEATAAPWHDAGYRVDYRRFYPHLTRRDLDRYRVVLVLGGRRPAAAHDALDVGDLAILTEWTRSGGVVVLGYPPDGVLDRWLMNQWLAWSGAGITIDDFAAQASGASGTPPSALAELTTGLRGTGFGTFPTGKNHSLLLSDDAQALARAAGPAHEPQAGPAIVAASRAANGLIVVLSRTTLGALGQTDSLDRTIVRRPAAVAGTRSFLVALARWTRRPAEWARIPTAGPRTPLRLDGGPLSVSQRAPRAAPPTGATVERLARGRPHAPLRPATGVPGWIARQGVRALAADFPALAPRTKGAARLAALDSLAGLLDIGAFNTLATDAHVAPLADSSSALRWDRDALRAAWLQVTSRLQPTSVRWIPLARPRELVPADTARSAPCLLDPMLWGRLASATRGMARFAADYAQLIPAIGFALDESTSGGGGPAVCDAAWQAGLGSLPRDSTLTRQRLARLNAVPLEARYDSLLDGGLLAAYDSAIARIVAQRAAALRAEVNRIRRDLMFAVVVDRSPADWFTRSLVRGLSTPTAPVLVLSPDHRARTLLGAADDVNLLHAIHLDPALFPPGGAAGLRAAVFRDQDGFWLGPAEAILAGPSDSVARLVRRLVKDR